MTETYKLERRFEAYLKIPGFENGSSITMILFKPDPENNTDTIDLAKVVKDYDVADDVGSRRLVYM